MNAETKKESPSASQTAATGPDLNTSTTPDNKPAPGSSASWQEIAASEAMILPEGVSRSMQDYYDNEAAAAARAERDGK